MKTTKKPQLSKWIAQYYMVALFSLPAYILLIAIGIIYIIGYSPLASKYGYGGLDVAYIYSLVLSIGGAIASYNAVSNIRRDKPGSLRSTAIIIGSITLLIEAIGIIYLIIKG